MYEKRFTTAVPIPSMRDHNGFGEADYSVKLHSQLSSFKFSLVNKQTIEETRSNLR